MWIDHRVAGAHLRASFAAYDVEFVVEVSRCRAPLHRSTGEKEGNWVAKFTTSRDYLLSKPKVWAGCRGHDPGVNTTN